MAVPTAIPCSASAFAVLSRELLDSGTWVRFRAKGHSMSPIVRDGDLVLVRPLKGEAIRVGDVVLRSADDRLVMHRVVRRHLAPAGSAFAIQGDQCLRPDGVFPADRLYGKVVRLERAGRCIDLRRPSMRLLANLAVLRSRWNLGRGKPSRLARRVLKLVPGLAWYLA